MKDEEFQKKLEFILERFDKIDREIKQYFDSASYSMNKQDSDGK